MSTDVSIYLLKTRTTFENAVDAEKIESDYEEVGLRDGHQLPFEHACYVRTTPPKVARWAGWLNSEFDLGPSLARTQTAGCLLLLKSRRRVFAVSFGAGRFALEPTRIEADFGLRVALQKVDPDALRHVVSKTLDVQTRENSTYHHAGGSIGEFPMSLDVEWLRTVSGAPLAKSGFSSLGGADSLRLRSLKNGLKELGEICGDALLDYKKETPEMFRFAQEVRPVPEKSDVATNLDLRLQTKLRNNDFSGLEVIVSFAIMEAMASATVFSGHRKAALVDLSKASVVRALGELRAKDSKISADRCSIDVLGADGERVHRFKILASVTAEDTIDNVRYVRVEGRWLRVSDEYVARIDARIKKLPLATELKLPQWDKTTHPEELDYNTYVSGQKGWLLQDQKLVRAGKSSFECCDALTKKGRFVHVKEGRSSSCLNHLFGQIYAAAELYVRNDSARKEIDRRYSDFWPGGSLEGVTPMFVAAIGRKSVRKDLLGRMLVAKINLLEHARRLRALNVDFAIAGFKVKA